MERLIAFILFLFISINTTGQNKNVADSAARPAITAFGKPDGEKSEMKIDKEGGSFTSSDGKIRLIIPEDAVSKNTTFSIQPVTNMMPTGNGKAYRLEPSGMQFHQPLQLIFNYDEEESKDSMQLLMGIAMQDEKGQWYGLKKFKLDTVAKTISGNINHFSTWVSFDKLKLVGLPDIQRLKVKKWAGLAVIGIYEPQTNDDLAELTMWQPPSRLIWRANRIIKGDNVEGRLTKGDIDESHARFNDYKAPDIIPTQNPVAISVELFGASITYNNVVFKNLKLVKNILIYDNAYEVSMVSSMDGNAGSVLGTVIYKDTGSFVVSLNGRDAKIIEKVNKNIPDKLDYKGKCTVAPLKPGRGNIHIAGVQNIKVIPPASPHDNPMIEIAFIRTPTILPLLKFTCPDRRRGSFTSTNAQAQAMASGMLPAFPQQIKFEAKEGEQNILKIGEAHSPMFLKITVKKLTDDLL